MGTKDERDPNSLLRDLWNETSPVTRVCLFGGLLLGLVIACILLANLVTDTGLGRRPRALIATLLIMGMLLAGGFVGLLAGVLVELVAGKVFGLKITRDEERRRRKRRPRE
jgi:hypothetical protein